MNRKISFWALVLVLLAFLAVAGTASAQQPGTDTSMITDDQVNAVAKQLYCPVCENIPLDVCPTQVCAQWRELIREMLAEGKTEAYIKNYFVNQYGDRVLAAPPARGLNWMIYILPPVSIAAGALILFQAFRSWKKPLPDLPPEQITRREDDEYVRRLEEELRKR